MLVFVDGVLKPAGTPTVIVEDPTATAWNVDVPVPWPPVKLTGEVTVPVPVELLVTGTDKVSPPRTGCSTDRLKLAGSSSAAAIVTFVSAATEVAKLEVAMVKPDGFTVTLMVALLYPVALTVNVAVPVARPWM